MPGGAASDQGWLCRLVYHLWCHHPSDVVNATERWSRWGELEAVAVAGRVLQGGITGTGCYRLSLIHI
eukprot:2447769-Pyramimonas_sp.AAC.1